MEKDLKKNVKKEFIPPKLEPNRKILTRSKATQPLTTKIKKSPTKRKQTKETKKGPPKSNRRKLVITHDEEEDEEEETKSNDLRKLKFIPTQLPMTIAQVCQNIRNSAGIVGFKQIKYDSLNKEDQENIEKYTIYLMIKFKYTPIELGKGNPRDLYNIFNAKKKWALSTKRKIRETTLAQIMHDLGKTHMSILLRYFPMKFMPTVREYKMLKNKVDEIVKESILICKKAFGLLFPLVEEKKEEERRDTIELDNQEDDDELESLEEQVRKLL